MFLLRLLLFSRFALRRFGPLAGVLTAYDIWRRLPRRHRQRLLAYGRRETLRLATSASAYVAGMIQR
jgi:hypothetical protein